MKKIVCLLVTVFMVVGLVAGCASTPPAATSEAPAASSEAPAVSSDAPAAPSDSEPDSEPVVEKTGVFAYPLYGAGLEKKSELKVGFSELSIADPWRVAQVNSMQEEADKRGYNYVMTDAQNKQDKQIADLEDLMSQGCNFLFLAPLNMDGFQSVLDQAKEKQIPIICLDREINAVYGEDVVCTVLADFITQGVNCAKWLDENIPGDIKVVQITGQPGGSDVRDRTKGFADTMEEINAAGKHKIEIVSSQNGQWSRTETQKIMQNIIQSLGKDGFNAVYAQNDEMAIGAVLAMKAAGIKVGEGGVHVVTVDGQKEAIRYVINGEISCISTCTPLFGPSAFNALEDYLQGKEMPNIYYNPEKIITKENAAEEIKVAWGN